MMPPCAGCLAGTNRGLRGTGCPRSPPAAACQGVWCLAQPFRRGQSPVPVPWCPGRAGDCGPRGGTGQRWSPWHSSRSEGLGCSSARHRDPGQASPLAHSENIGTPGAFFPGLPFLRSRRAGCWRGWHAGRAGTAVWPTEPRLRGSSCSASRGGSPREGESRTWSWGGPYLGLGGVPLALPAAVATALAGAGELFSTQAGSVQTGAPRRRRTRSARFHLPLQVNKHRLAKGGAGGSPGLPQAGP